MKGFEPLLFFNVYFEDGISINLEAAFQANPHNLFDGVSSRTIEIESSTWSSFSIKDLNEREEFVQNWKNNGHLYQNDYEQFYDDFSRVFVGKASLNRTPALPNKLLPDASNVAQIIGLIFENEGRKNDFVEWLRILIPEFKDIEVRKSNIDGSFDFLIHEKSSELPFSRYLISDGTYNILALMAAVYIKAPNPNSSVSRNRRTAFTHKQ